MDEINKEDHFINMDNLLNGMTEMATEIWRLKKVHNKLLEKLDDSEQKKYGSQFLWFDKKVENIFSKLGFQIVNVEGKTFDIGMPVTPINADDFQDANELIIEQMLEPIILRNSELRKTGTVLLGRNDK